MKAVIIRRHGGPEALEYGDAPTPEPGAGEVLVRLRAAGLNHADIAVREGWAHFGAPLPMILGVEGAGEVAALGSGVTDVAVGTRVVLDPLLNCGHCRYCRLGRESSCLDCRSPGEHRDGTYAEYIALPAANIVPLPQHISFEAAAVAVVAFCTAWHLLITRGRLVAGETILIVGAGGGVASAGVQIARLAGARVIATTSTAEKAARLRELGADEVINYRATPDFDVAVRELTGGEGVDAVQDNVGLATFQKSLNSLRQWGRLLGVGSHTGTNVQARLWQIYSRELEVIGSHQWTHPEVQTVLNLVFRERLRPIVDRVFSLSQAAEAHRVLDTGAQFGKLVLTM
ncbi:MAG: alcohol dehydrogenase catalytic domain-containing protein [Anaerolineae bacterium]|nr:alcohol dehydrogenase catalytic domain-containing protein [Anaerolineae bacterium]